MRARSSSYRRSRSATRLSKSVTMAGPAYPRLRLPSSVPGRGRACPAGAPRLVRRDRLRLRRRDRTDRAGLAGQSGSVVEREVPPFLQGSGQRLRLERVGEKRERTLVLRLFEPTQAASERRAHSFRRSEQARGALGIAGGGSASGELERPADVVAVVRRRRDGEALRRVEPRLVQAAGLERGRRETAEGTRDHVAVLHPAR